MHSITKRTIINIWVTLTALLLLCPPVQSQPDSSNIGWKIGLNSGLFLPSNLSASFYNGKEGNENTIRYILNNQYQYNEVFNLLEASDTFLLHALPGNMRYEPGLMIGFFFRNNFREDMSWFLQFNQAQLKTADFYTLEVDPKPNISTDADLRSFMIWGEEQRFLFDFGIGREFPGKHPMLKPFLELGFTLTNTRVKSNKIFVYEREYSIINIYGKDGYIPGAGQQAMLVEQGGIGAGGFVNVGTKIYINNYFSIDPTMHFYIATTNLEPYNAIRPHFYFNIRLSANNLFLFKEKHL